jgi:Fe-S-cluster-containing dehydrogenase component
LRYGLVIDLKRCIGCHGCQIFCRAANATPAGMLWSRVLFYESGQYPHGRKMPLPVQCRHCTTPACVAVCPTGASVQRPDGIVTIVSDKCTGCLNCLLVCPAGARHCYPDPEYPAQAEYFPGQGLTPYEKAGSGRHRVAGVGKCDFCLSRIEQGLKPACVANCMTKARSFGDLDDRSSDVSQLLRTREVLEIHPGVSPGKAGTPASLDYAVYYLAR